MTDVANGADQNAPAKPSIEETMAAAFDKMQAAETSAPAVPSGGADLPSAEVKSEQPPPSSDDRPRGPDGKFAPKQAEAAPKEAAPANEISDQPQETKPDATASTPPATAPVSWSQDAKAAWASLPVAVQQAIIKREQEASTGIKSYADKLKASEALQSVIGPRAQMLAAQYGTTEKGIETLFQLSDFAGNNPQGFIQWFAQQRGIDLNQLGTLPNQQAQPAPVDPQYAALQQRFGQLENMLVAQQRAEQDRQTAELNRQIEAFKSDPKNAHFEELRQDMARLIQGGMASDLSDAYEKAMWANPTVRAKVIESQRAQEEAQRKAEAEKKAAEARKIAAVNVATKGTVGASPTATKSMEETMRQVADRIYSAA